MGLRPSSFGSAVGVLCVCVAVLVFAPAAFAGPSGMPWWGLTSGARPTDLHSGLAVNEVRTLTVSATKGEYFVAEPGARFQEELLEVFEGKREPSELRDAILPYNASAATVQAALETGVYGPGNVEVTGGPGDEAGDKPYVITFKGELAGGAVGLTAESGFIASFLGAAEPLGGGGPTTVTVAERTPAHADGKLVVTAENLGNANMEGSTSPIVITDKLPEHLRAVSAFGVLTSEGQGSAHPTVCSIAKGVATCRLGEALRPYSQIEMEISVVVEPGAVSGEENEVQASGGGAATKALRRPVRIGGEPPFGIEEYELLPENEDGSLDTRAGSHPFQLTTVVDFNQTAQEEGDPASGLQKDVRAQWPAGLVGNPTAIAQCTAEQFDHLPLPECSPQTVIGATVTTTNVPSGGGLQTYVEPLYNLVPNRGEPVRAGWSLAGVRIYVDTSVRTGGDYGVTVSVNNITQFSGTVASKITVWGVPGDPAHDGQRGVSCDLGEASCVHLDEQSPPPFLSLPTSCTGALTSSVSEDSWEQQGVFTDSVGPFEPMAALDGCNHPPFEPSIGVAPDVSDGSTPTGLTVDVHLPQESVLHAKSVAESTLKETTVALPVGVTLNPGGADGLEACSEAQIGFTGIQAETGLDLFTEKLPEPLEPGHNFCPDASKIGTVKIKTPLLPNALEGAVYLAQQNANPFGSLIAMYIVAYDPVSGSLVKLPGQVVTDPVTGQIVSTFDHTPQLPFEDLELHFFGGERAPLSTPSACGAYTTSAVFTPWTGEAPVRTSSTFDIASGPSGSPCSSPLPFDPSLTAGTTNIQAGAFSPFTMTMSREDGNQNLQAIRLRMPPGLLGTLSGVKLCEEPQANQGTCGPESLIGETTVSVGLGGNPYAVKGGRVYITGPYDGAPFGLSIVNPAKAGPFDLGEGACDCVLVRAKIEVDPVTSVLTITSDNSGPHKIPQILDGIPLQIKHVNVTIDRPGFTFNPTDCAAMAITGSLSSTEGSSSALSVPFQATNCATLAFKPQFKVSTSGKTSRADGTSLSVKLAYPKAAWGTQANIKSVKVDLPKQLPSRLTTLQKACPVATFEVNPASCQAASRVGTATATTPIIPVALSGPAYFVSHGGAKFPELIIVLSGYGVTVDLHGETFISHAGITSSTFHEVPDVPIGTFALTLPAGTNSALAANGNLCTSKLKMPTAFTAQNGLTIKQSTPITVTGCPKHKTKNTKGKKNKQTHKANQHRKSNR